MASFRDGLLDGQTVALSGAPSSAIADALAQLGARLHAIPEDVSTDDELERWARDHAPFDLLIHDARVRFGNGGAQGLRAAGDEAWGAVRALAAGALIPAGGGRVVLVTPAAASGPFAEAARDALENLVRTLSVEWARYGVTTTAIAPGPRTTEQQLASVACFLASPAGGYYSGCRFSLGLAG